MPIRPHASQVLAKDVFDIIDRISREHFGHRISTPEIVALVATLIAGRVQEDEEVAFYEAVSEFQRRSLSQEELH
jgi:hypothetical protein